MGKTVKNGFFLKKRRYFMVFIEKTVDRYKINVYPEIKNVRFQRRKK